MKKHLCLILLMIIGCASSQANKVDVISTQYEALVLDDGVDLDEAKVIAKRQLIKRNMIEKRSIHFLSWEKMRRRFPFLANSLLRNSPPQRAEKKIGIARTAE